MLKPKRVFLDSMTQFHYLSPDVFPYRKQATAFLRFLVDRGSTVLFTSEGTYDVPEDVLKFISDGVIKFLKVGNSMTGLRGILVGQPEMVDEANAHEKSAGKS